MEARTEALVQAAELEAQRATRGPIRLMMLARLQEIGNKPASTDAEAISWWVARTLRLSNHQKLQVRPCRDVFSIGRSLAFCNEIDVRMLYRTRGGVNNTIINR